MNNQFFQQLHAVAQHTPMSLLIAPDGPDRLSVTILPRPTGAASGKKGFSQPITCKGTPVELDAELPAKLVEYGNAVNNVRASFNLPLNEVEAERQKADKKAERDAAKKAEEEAEEKRKAEAAEKRKAAKEAAAREAAEAAEKRRLAREAKKNATAGAAPSEAAPEDEQAEKARLVEAARTLLSTHGKKLNRELFIKKVKGGRRYERLFASFRELLDAAAPAASNLTLPGATNPPEQDPASTAQATDEAATPPTPPAQPPAVVEPPAPPKPEPKRIAVDMAGVMLETLTSHHAVGDSVTLAFYPIQPLVVRAIIEVSEAEVHFQLGAWPVHDGEWNSLGVLVYTEPQPGDTLEVGAQHRRVVAVEDGRVLTIALPPKPATAAAPTTAVEA